MNRHIVYFCIVFLELYVVSADEILGCNGFLKSDVQISFSSVEIQLLTKQGVLKDHTDCAPNNGYYFLPIYDKGEYILKVSTPRGWKFEPSEVPIVFDGSTDPCSLGKDINFNFLGFAVDGQVVSSGFKIGPKGVAVKLLPQDSSTPLLSTTTSVEGKFSFSPVPPGSYRVEISHPNWVIEKSEAVINVVKGNSEISSGQLVVTGYDINGVVTNENRPINGVSFLLYSTHNLTLLKGCEPFRPPDFASEGSLADYHLICHVSSNAEGVFRFLTVKPGKYVIVPYYKGFQATEFDVDPRSLTITVGHNSLHLTTPFQVKGFTASGKVLWSPEGKPIVGATVYLNGKMSGKTNDAGVYSLGSMKIGQHTLRVESENVKFKETKVQVSSPTLPDLYPESYKICGNFHSSASAGPYKVELKSGETKMSEVTTDAKGSYCLYLTPGVYTFVPVLSNEQMSHGLMFSPTMKTVEVRDSPIQDVDFSQLRSKVVGKIACMTQCPLITVHLKPKGQGASLQAIAKNGRYEFADVLPGDYDIYLEPGWGWCWDKESQSLSVMNEIVDVPLFSQSGYSVTIVASHSTSVTYYPEGKDNEKLKLNVSPGSTHICVPKSTPYIFEPEGCHGYNESKFRWVAGSVSLNAVTHANSYFVLVPEEIPDLSLEATNFDLNDDEKPTILKPNVITKTNEGVKHEYTLQLKPNEGLKLVPIHDVYLFTPQSAEIRGLSDCVNSTKALFTAEKGLIVSGKVLSGDDKGVEGVLVTVKDEMGATIVSTTTQPNGYYQFPPLKPVPNIKLIAEKEGFVLTGLERWGDFSAHKLAEIIVTVVDMSTKEKLQGVLLSLSGGKNYRRNSQTNTEGTMSFLSLSPGEYFLKPMMKEYRFHPQSKIINVNEGATVTVQLSGERIAYSGIGEVLALSGEGESGVVVEAIGVGPCSNLQEEATSNDNGIFRIRGLKPQCEYLVRVKSGPDVNHHVLKSEQDDVPIKVGEMDVSEIKLYALRPSTRTDVMVYVVADRPEDLKTLRLKLIRDDSPEVSVNVVKLSEYKQSSGGYLLTSVVIVLPPIPADGRSYILQLESSLPLGTHEYTNRPVHFKANGSLKVFRMAFSPNLKSRDAELSQSSYLVLPFLIILGLMYYNKNAVVNLAAAFLERTRPTQGLSKSTSDDSATEQFIDFSKKRSKSRKT